MTLLWAILILLLLPICCFAPGFYFVRKLKWSSSETLCASIVLSLILIYLAATGIYWSNINWKWGWLISAGWVALTWLSRHELKRFISRAVVRQQLAAFGTLFGLGLLLLAVIEHYSGGSWAADWAEHYQRSQFFLNRLPFTTKFISVYILPSRPPMMHLIAAYFLGHVRTSFDLFQLISLFLNTLAFFACVLAAGQLMPHGAKRVWLIAALLGTCPMFVQNITWTWNKELTAFFIIVSIAFYLRGWRTDSSPRIIAAAITMAAAIICHYSAGPYAVFLFLHYVGLLIFKRRRLLEPLISAGAAAALLLTWFAWSLAVYGRKDTFESNTTVTDAAQMSSHARIIGILRNAWTTFIPFPLRLPLAYFDVDFQQPNYFGRVRDFWFNIYQPNLPCAMGLLAWIVVLYLIVKLLGVGDRRAGWFWLTLTGFVVPVSIIVHSSTELYGVAHVCLQPLILIGRTLLSGAFFLRQRWVRITLVLSLLMDVILGLVLQFRMEMISIAPSTGSFPIIPLSSEMLSFQAAQNSGYRFHQSIVYLADHFAGLRLFIFLLSLALFAYFLLLFASAAMSGKSTPIPGRSAFAGLVVGLFAIGSAICMTDHIAGYNQAGAIVAPPIQDNEHYILAGQPFLDRLKTDPESADLFYGFAVVSYQFGRLDIALKSAGNALLLNPQYIKARYLVGLIQVAYMHPLEDADINSVFYRVQDKSEVNYVTYGGALFDRGFTIKSRQVLADAVLRYPNSASAHATYGIVLFKTGQPAEGITQCKIALHLRPEVIEIANTLRNMLVATGTDQATAETTIKQIQNGG